MRKPRLKGGSNRGGDDIKTLITPILASATLIAAVPALAGDNAGDKQAADAQVMDQGGEISVIRYYILTY